MSAVKVSPTHGDCSFAQPEAEIVEHGRAPSGEQNSRSQDSLVEMRFAEHASFGERKPRASRGTRSKADEEISNRCSVGEGVKIKEQHVETYYILDQLTVQLRHCKKSESALDEIMRVIS